MRPARSHFGSARLLVGLAASALIGFVVTGSISIPEGSARALSDCTPGADWGTVRRDLADRVVTLANAHGVHSSVRSLATCTFRVPERARGSQMTGTIRVSSGGHRTKRWFSRKVR